MQPSTPIYVILVSAFIGSASGIILSKLIDIFQVKRQYKMELKKMYFQKKIEVYEKTTTYWNTVLGTIQNLDTVIKSGRNPDHYFNEGEYAKIIASITKEYEDISKEASALRASLTLYAEIPEECYVSPITREYFNLSAELRNPIESDERFNRLDSLLIEIKTKTNNLIKILRYDLKRFDV